MPNLIHSAPAPNWPAARSEEGQEVLRRFLEVERLRIERSRIEGASVFLI